MAWSSKTLNYFCYIAAVNIGPFYQVSSFPLVRLAHAVNDIRSTILSFVLHA
jgi:hypothetical protein